MVESLVYLQLLCVLHQVQIKLMMNDSKQHPKFIWMEVTRDKYEFPIHIADTAEELAKLAGVKNGTSVISAISKASKHNVSRCKYQKVALDDNDEEKRENDEN